MRLLPLGDVLAVEPILAAGHVVLDPVLGDGRMQRGPLGHDARRFVALDFRPFVEFLKPTFDVIADVLALVGPAFIDHDRSELVRHAVAKQVVVGRPVGRAGGGGVVRRRCRRWPGLEILLGRERLGNQTRTDLLAAPLDETALGLRGEDHLPNAQQDQRIGHAAEHHRDDEQPETRAKMLEHKSVFESLRGNENPKSECRNSKQISNFKSQIREV